MDDTNNTNLRKRKKGLETTRQILDIAAGLFARNGYDGVSLREIARKVGIQESSLYNHFKSKGEILETLFDEFIRLVPQTRPTDEDIDQLLLFMTPEEVFKHILFHVGKSVRDTLANTAMIINYEKFRNPRAAEMYYQHVVNEPAAYYERLITKMIARNMVKPVDAGTLARQYNYVSIALTKEYLMAQYGLADVHAVVGSMLRTIEFFCGLMARDRGGQDEKEKKG